MLEISTNAGLFFCLTYAAAVLITFSSFKISDLFNYKGKIIWDKSKPDGTPKKLLNIQKIQSLGWDPKISLSEGIRDTIEFYKFENKV